MVVSYISLAALTSASREMDLYTGFIHWIYTLYTFDMATLATCTSACTLHHSMCTRCALASLASAELSARVWCLAALCTYDNQGEVSYHLLAACDNTENENMKI